LGRRGSARLEDRGQRVVGGGKAEAHKSAGTARDALQNVRIPQHEARLREHVDGQAELLEQLEGLPGQARACLRGLVAVADPSSEENESPCRAARIRPELCLRDPNPAKLLP
jgi:hypothetical protein